ncbi:MAG: four helix bundle protein [Bacteroidia bacterium]|jgi:four helix bundle protein
MRNFRTMHIWKESLELTTIIYDLVKVLPPEERYGLKSQITRSSVSIPSNIAEGCRRSNKEFRHFLNIALGSSYELETQLIISSRIGLVDSETVKNVQLNLTTLQKRINAFRNSIKHTP